MTEISNFLGGMKFSRTARVQLILFLKPVPEITVPETIKGNEKISRGLYSNNFSPMKTVIQRSRGDSYNIAAVKIKTFIQSNADITLFKRSLLCQEVRELC